MIDRKQHSQVTERRPPKGDRGMWRVDQHLAFCINVLRQSQSFSKPCYSLHLHTHQQCSLLCTSETSRVSLFIIKHLLQLSTAWGLFS